MKKDDLTKLGLTDEQISEVFKLNGQDVNNEKAKLTAMATERDNLKTQLTTVSDSLKRFEGVDVDALQNEIQKLNNQIAQQKTEYENQIADRDFNDLMKQSIQDAGGRNATAIEAVIGSDKLNELKTSKNQKEDVKQAIENAKSEFDYLFKSDQPIKNPVASTGGGNVTSEETRMEAARKVMGLDKAKGKN